MILLTYGTRPEYIKIKPLIESLTKENVPFKTLFTGQHEMLNDTEYDFRISINNDGYNRLDSIISNCMNIPEEIYENVKYLLVQGDTTSVLGLALAAMNRKIKLIHLEAGLRTYDFENPYPEEYNRRLVSSIANIHLCPTHFNKNNLIDEGLRDNIYVVGNTGLDNLNEIKKDCEYTNKVLITLHRRENHYILDEWFTEINKLAIDNPELEFILPLHPNPNVQKHRHLLTNVNVVEPLKHDELLNLLVKVKMVITDSGGLQEECSFLNKKCLVCRETTERPESIGISSFLIPTPSDLSSFFYGHIDDYKIDVISPFGDGNASEKITKILKELK